MFGRDLKMPLATLTDIAVRNLKSAGGQGVVYIDKTLKGLGAKGAKLGNVNLIKRADARAEAV
jgi:hypothetical protein